MFGTALWAKTCPTWRFKRLCASPNPGANVSATSSENNCLCLSTWQWVANSGPMNRCQFSGAWRILYGTRSCQDSFDEARKQCKTTNARNYACTLGSYSTLQKQYLAKQRLNTYHEAPIIHHNSNFRSRHLRYSNCITVTLHCLMTLLHLP